MAQGGNQCVGKIAETSWLGDELLLLGPICQMNTRGRGAKL